MRWGERLENKQVVCNKCKRGEGKGDAYGMQLLADWIHILRYFSLKKENEKYEISDKPLHFMVSESA